MEKSIILNNLFKNENDLINHIWFSFVQIYQEDYIYMAFWKIYSINPRFYYHYFFLFHYYLFHH